MSLSKDLASEIRHVIDKIQSGHDSEICVPDLWKLEDHREELDKAFQDACLNLWIHMGDTALNRSGYTNSILSFWDEIIGKKEEEKSSYVIEHCDDSWYF